MNRTTKICKVLFVLCCAASLLNPGAALAKGKNKKGKGKDKKEAETEAPKQDMAEVEFYCGVDVFYSWRRMPDARMQGMKDAGDDKLYAPIEVFHTAIGEQGTDKAELTSKLLTRVPAAKTEARKECETAHEKEALCMVRGLKKVQKDYQLLDYSARKQILDSLGADCKLQRGQCISTRAGDVTCFEQRKPGQGAAAGAGGEMDAGADDKKKKKKKGKK